jgi:hypothetical protein
MKRSILCITLIVGCLMMPLMSSGSSLEREVAVRPYDCTNCEVAGGCFVCTGAFSGGSSCLADCFHCTLWGSCDISGLDAQNREGDAAKFVARTLKLQSNTVREIAARDPNFALALIKLSKYEIVRETGKMFITPVAVSTNDIEQLLKGDKGAAGVLSKLQVDAQRINKLIAEGRASPLIYSISLSDANSLTPTLNLQLVSGSALDSGYSTLDVKLRASGESAIGKLNWRIEEWEIR